MTRQFTWNGATFTIHDPTVETAMNVEYLIGVLRSGQAVPTRLFNHYLSYANFLAMTEVSDGDPGFTFPSLDASEDDLRAGFAAYKALSADFRGQWNTATAPVEKKAEPSDEPTQPNSTPILNATPEPS